jgi:hypothetical protein
VVVATGPAASLHRGRQRQRRFRTRPAHRARPRQRRAAGAGHRLKAFTEQFIIAEIYVQALRAAGFQVTRRTVAGDERAAYRELKQQGIHAYPEDTGTALTSLYREAPDRCHERLAEARTSVPPIMYALLLLAVAVALLIVGVVTAKGCERRRPRDRGRDSRRGVRGHPAHELS